MATKMIADKSITFRIDGTRKELAEEMLEEIGINMTTYLVSSIQALIRERKIPFDMVTNEYINDQIILAKLAEVDNDPNNKWLSRDEVFAPIRERFGYEV